MIRKDLKLEIVESGLLLKEKEKNGLKWHGGFKPTKLTIGEVKLYDRLQLNEVDSPPLNLKEVLSDKKKIKKASSLLEGVRGKLKNSRSIICEVVNVDNRFYELTTTDDDEKTCSVGKESKITKLIISEADKISGKDKKDAIYGGSIFFDDLVEDDATSGYSIQCYAPLEFINDIYNRVHCSSTLEMYAWIKIHSYSNEMDDSFREHWMPRDLIFSEFGSVFLEQFDLSQVKQLCINGDKESHSSLYNKNSDKLKPSNEGEELLNKVIKKVALPLWAIFVALLFLIR